MRKTGAIVVMRAGEKARRVQHMSQVALLAVCGSHYRPVRSISSTKPHGVIGLVIGLLLGTEAEHRHQSIARWPKKPPVGLGALVRAAAGI
jgi:hypothetical protein